MADDTNCTVSATPEPWRCHFILNVLLCSLCTGHLQVTAPDLLEDLLEMLEDDAQHDRQLDATPHDAQLDARPHDAQLDARPQEDAP